MTTFQERVSVVNLLANFYIVRIIQDEESIKSYVIDHCMHINCDNCKIQKTCDDIDPNNIPVFDNKELVELKNTHPEFFL